MFANLTHIASHEENPLLNEKETLDDINPPYRRGVNPVVESAKFALEVSHTSFNIQDVKVNQYHLGDQTRISRQPCY